MVIWKGNRPVHGAIHMPMYELKRELSHDGTHQCMDKRPVLQCTRGEGGRRPPSPLVRVAAATLISSEEVV